MQAMTYDLLNVDKDICRSVCLSVCSSCCFFSSHSVCDVQLLTVGWSCAAFLLSNSQRFSLGQLFKIIKLILLKILMRGQKITQISSTIIQQPPKLKFTHLMNVHLLALL